jgi:hypothetical protein
MENEQNLYKRLYAGIVSVISYCVPAIMEDSKI